MIQQTTIKFLKDLKRNNNKQWFDENRSRYESVKSDFLFFINQVITDFSKTDISLGTLLAKDCLFRINRDVRFSKNKSPYKNNISAYFNKDGKKGTGAGYYLHIEPGKSFLAAGIWMPLPADLAKIRQEIDYNFAAWKKLIGHPSFTRYFKEGVCAESTLVRPPKGYTEDNPAIGFIKMKNFYVRSSLTDLQIQNNLLTKDIAATYQAMKPFVDYLNTAID